MDTEAWVATTPRLRSRNRFVAGTRDRGGKIAEDVLKHLSHPNERVRAYADELARYDADLRDARRQEHQACSRGAPNKSDSRRPWQTESCESGNLFRPSERATATTAANARGMVFTVMARSEPVGRMTYPEYLVAERASDVRHEFVDGQVYAMAGGTPEHGALAAAIIRELGIALGGKPCRVYSSDVRVRVQETGLATYPDASVVCGSLETDPADPDAIVNPVLLIEVLSESTEAYDRGAKASHYRRIPSLREYVLLAQDAPRIEVYRRNEAGRWELFEARTGERVALASLAVELDVQTIYQDPLRAD